jgi:hypothetical protein
MSFHATPHEVTHVERWLICVKEHGYSSLDGKSIGRHPHYRSRSIKTLNIRATSLQQEFTEV